MIPNPTGKAAAAADGEQAALDATPKGPGRPKAVPQKINESVLNGLRDYMDRQAEARGRFTQADLAVKLGYSTTYVSRAFSGQFNGVVKDFESRALQLIEGEKKRRVDNTGLIREGFLVEPMRAFLDTVRLTEDIGVGWNPAGKGKTKGIHVYMEQNPLTIYVEASVSFSGWRTVRGAVLDQLSNKRLTAGESWDLFLQRKFTDSGYLLIIDNAHLLTQSARRWIAYDWHDKTHCPVALIGNPEIVQQWRADDQLFSRVGLARQIKPDCKAADTAAAMINLFMPDAGGDKDLLKLATAVVQAKGACRALRKHLLLAREIAKTGRYANPAACFRAAHCQLLSTFKFADDGSVVETGPQHLTKQAA
jgi:DNA transposition AAA+ family ATPase